MPIYTVKHDQSLEPLRLITASDLEYFADDIASKHKSGRLFVPSDSIYNPKPSLDHAYDIWHKLAAHVGLKHISITIHINEDQQSTYVLAAGKEPSITLGINVLENNFVLAAALAQLFCAYLVVSKHKYQLSTLKDNTALLQAIAMKLGFGIVMANGLAISNELPKGYNSQEFAHQFRLYTSQNRIVDSVWHANILAAATSWLTAKKPSTSVIKISSITNFEKDKSKSNWKLLLVVPMLFFAISVFGYIQIKAQQSSQRLSSIKSALANREEKQALQACKKLLEHRESTWPSDVFIDRNVQATLTECKKLENKINFDRLAK